MSAIFWLEVNRPTTVPHHPCGQLKLLGVAFLGLKTSYLSYLQLGEKVFDSHWFFNQWSFWSFMQDPTGGVQILFRMLRKQLRTQCWGNDLKRARNTVKKAIFINVLHSCGFKFCRTANVPLVKPGQVQTRLKCVLKAPCHLWSMGVGISYFQTAIVQRG